MEASFKHLVDQNYGILYKIGRSYTNSEADFRDLYQEMLIQLWQSFPRFKQMAKGSTWLYRVALNTAITFRKKQQKEATQIAMSPDFLKDLKTSPDILEKEIKKGQQIDLLYTCINQLNKDDRAVILLHLEGNNYETIAEITGITSNYVGVKLLRIKKRLYKLLNQHGYARI